MTEVRTNMTNEEIWQAVLAQIQFHISKANFATWLKNTYILSKKDGGVVVSVPNNFSKEWLEHKYHKLIFKILYNLDSEIRDVQYMVERVLPKEREQTLLPPSPFSSREFQLEFQEFKTNKSTNLNPRYTFDNFIVGSFNELPHAAALAVTQHPGVVYNPLFIYGGVGLGKTHLIQAVGNQLAQDSPQKKVKYVSSEKFTSGVVSSIKNQQMDVFKMLYREVDILIIDDVQFLAGKEKTQEELFHTFNTLYGNNKQVVLSSDRPPRAIPALEERLRSRFEGGMIADIGVPDFETRMAILNTKVQEKGLELEQEVCEYIATHIQRNIRELEGAINRVLTFRRLNNKSPSLVEAKTLLKSVIQNPSRTVHPKKILQMVAEFYGLKESELIAPSRKKEIVRPRQIAMYLVREELKGSYPFIGKSFGGKDHTTAIYACQKIAKELQESEMLNDEINLIRQRIYSG